MSDHDFEGLPEGWSVEPVGDLATRVVVGHVGPSSGHRDPDGIPFFMGKNVKRGALDLTELERVTRDFHERERKSQLSPGDVVVVRIGRSGEAAVVPDSVAEANCSGLVVVKSPLKVSARYLAAYLNSPVGQARAAKQVRGTTRRTLNTKSIQAALVPVAPPSEQHAIVSALDSYFSRLDDAVANLERVQRNLKRYRASVLKAAVEGRLVPTEAELARAEGRDYEPASVLLERILAERRRRWEEAELEKMLAKGKPPKNDKWKAKYQEPAEPDLDGLPELPEGWCWASLEALTCPVRLICYGILMPKDHVPGGIPYVKVRDMRGGSLDVNRLQRTTPEIAGKYPRSVLRGGDLLVAIRGTYGRVVDVPDALDGGNITQDSARIDLLPGIATRYGKVALLAEVAQAFFKRVARGVAVKGVNIGDLRRTPIPVPPEPEQVRIAEQVEDLLTLEEAQSHQVERSIARVSVLRAAVLRSAFMGELVSDPRPRAQTGASDLMEASEVEVS